MVGGAKEKILKQTQPGIIVNQSVSAVSMEVGRSKGNQKQKNNHKKKQLKRQYVRNLFKLKKEDETIKDKIIRDTKNIVRLSEEAYWKLVRIDIFLVTFVLNMKIMVIKVKIINRRILWQN